MSKFTKPTLSLKQVMLTWKLDCSWKVVDEGQSVENELVTSKLCSEFNSVDFFHIEFH